MLHKCTNSRVGDCNKFSTNANQLIASIEKGSVKVAVRAASLLLRSSCFCFKSSNSSNLLIQRNAAGAALSNESWGCLGCLRRCETLAKCMQQDQYSDRENFLIRTLFLGIPNILEQMPESYPQKGTAMALSK